jgi:glycosyltransferase involved in cell wall biosynthesis
MKPLQAIRAIARLLQVGPNLGEHDVDTATVTILPLKTVSHHRELKLKNRPPSLAIVLNSSMAVGFLRGQLEYFLEKGFAVTVFCPAPRSDEWRVPRPDGVTIVEMPIDRTISPLRDVVSLWRLWRAMGTLRPTVTNVGTPKAGLLGGVAAWVTGVPCRVYTLHGLRFETARGWKRQLLIKAERLACRFAHRVICVSASVREKALALGLTTEERSVVFGSGSCNGIDASRFAPEPELAERAGKLRQQLGIPACATVVMFVGRLTRDKGIEELFEAFRSLDRSFPNLRLLLVGCFEKDDPLSAEALAGLRNHPHVIFAGPVVDTPAYYATADIVVLPSHREGLPTVVLEAQAAGKPVVAARATGIVDVVSDGETGLLFPVGDASALAETLARLLTDRTLLRKLELAGPELVKREFRPEQIWRELHRCYLEILDKNPPRWAAESRSKVVVPASHKP